jgi:hypothetical protein
MKKGKSIFHDNALYISNYYFISLKEIKLSTNTVTTARSLLRFTKEMQLLRPQAGIIMLMTCGFLYRILMHDT